MSRTTVEKALAAADRPLLLQSDEALAEAASAWSGAPVLGIDTEFVRERTYRADLGLVQVSDGRTAWLWDPLANGSAKPVQRMLKERGVLKILHSGSEDLEVMQHALDALPRPLVDTQVACALAGQSLQLSLQGAVKWLFDVEIGKEHTRSNWCRRPLKPGQLHYAAMDVVLLPLMHLELRKRLEDLGRWEWLQEEVERGLQGALAESDPGTAWQRIGGASRLDDVALRALRALAEWREGVAAARNRARGFVVSDAALLQIARLQPARPSDLGPVEGLHPVARDRYGATLVEAVAGAASDPRPLERTEPLTNAQRKQLDRMRRVVQEQAKVLGVDPALLASRREMERLLRAVHAGEAPPERFLGWRRAVITDELLGLIG